MPKTETPRRPRSTRESRVARLRKQQAEVSIYPFSGSDDPVDDPRNARAIELLGSQEVRWRAQHFGDPSPEFHRKRKNQTTDSNN